MRECARKKVKMNKEMQIKKIKEKLGVSQKEAAHIYESFCEMITEGIREYGKVKLDPFTFTTKDVPERKHRNPKTGEEIIKAAHKKVAVKVSKNFIVE